MVLFYSTYFDHVITGVAVDSHLYSSTILNNILKYDTVVAYWPAEIWGSLQYSFFPLALAVASQLLAVCLREGGCLQHLGSLLFLSSTATMEHNHANDLFKSINATNLLNPSITRSTNQHESIDHSGHQSTNQCID